MEEQELEQQLSALKQWLSYMRRERNGRSYNTKMMMELVICSKSGSRIMMMILESLAFHGLLSRSREGVSRSRVSRSAVSVLGEGCVVLCGVDGFIE